jgi:hypothetical protein
MLKVGASFVSPPMSQRGSRSAFLTPASIGAEPSISQYQLATFVLAAAQAEKETAQREKEGNNNLKKKGKALIILSVFKRRKFTADYL